MIPVLSYFVLEEYSEHSDSIKVCILFCSVYIICACEQCFHYVLCRFTQHGRGLDVDAKQTIILVLILFFRLNNLLTAALSVDYQNIVKIL